MMVEKTREVSTTSMNFHQHGACHYGRRGPLLAAPLTSPWSYRTYPKGVVPEAFTTNEMHSVGWMFLFCAE